MIALLAAVVAGGAGGSVARYGLGLLAAKYGKPAHYATLFINCLGSLLLGLLAGAALDERHAAWYALAGTGFLGGFTTFSTLNAQLVAMLEQRRYRAAFYYMACTYGIGLPLAAAGYSLARAYHF
ncbi:fluoride efflux transporter FluC [Paenibacillus thailandensis]|jgi:CrcB protein|uniref:Fluoride-specific ion channel FluC n=1 Tax=Paenibacillus thailandensis TaxID=393250 RepID=A0ABW5QYB7_9BACL